MKFSKIILSLLISSVLLNSCKEEELDILPVLQDPLETAIKDEESLQAMLVGGYDQASSANLFGANILIHGDLISDNVFVSTTNDGYFTGVNNLGFSPQTDLGQLGSLYRMIVYANIVLNHPLENSTTVENIEGQAHMMRAVGLFYALNLFSSNPTSGQYQELGVPVYTEPYNPSTTYPRATIAATYDQIILDLEQAIAKMNQNINLDKGFFSPTAAKFLLSKVYLTRGQAGDYQLALDYADEVINSSPGEFGFVNSTDYVSYFNGEVALSENQPETIWEINFTTGDNLQLNAAISSFYHRTGAHGSLLFRQDFYNMFEAGDVRRGLFSTAGAPTSDTPLGVWTTKWPRTVSPEGNYAINVKVFRMSEAVLNRIEALYHLGQTTTALTELNAFAATRGASPYAGTDLLNDILTERRKEFFGEGQRFYDLKRNNLGFVKSTNCAGSVCEVPANSRYMVFPMPEVGEMLLNPLMTQHPLWQ